MAIEDIEYDQLGNVISGGLNSPEIENKTNRSASTSNPSKSSSSEQQVVQSGQKNILNSYRSITYNFTFAGLRKNYLENPEELRNSEMDLVILRSGGKGFAGIKGVGPLPDDQRKSQEEVYDKFDAKTKRVAQSAVDTANTNLEIISKFNEVSPGRFDMFIDNVEIESLMQFSPDANNTLPTKFKFEVIEPYSINGFIEALYVTALAAGYPNYLSASYVLKVEFKGYPDNDIDEFTSPVTIPDSVRYFPLGITNIEVDVSEKGTRYRIDAVPYNERAFGQSNVVQKAIKMEGETVKEILNNFIDNINKQAVTSWKESKVGANVNEVDTYAIKFPSWSDTSGWTETPENEMASAKLVELMTDNALYKLADPSSLEKPNAYKANGSAQPSPQEQSKSPEAIKYNPKKTVIQFSEGMNIHDVIAAVIRDSEYVRNILKDIKKHTNSFGLVDYFMIRIETTNSEVINSVTKKPVQKLTYVVSPYKIHYSKIPNFADNLIDESELKKLSLREYNYIYTGNNVDVLSFKLNFNTLYFEAVPAAMGNKDTPEAKTSAGNSNNVDVSQNSPSNDISAKMQVPLHPKKVAVTPLQAYSGNASQPLDDPYSVLARGLHDAVVNSKASMLTGELEILGDPFYLCTGGLGNYNPKPAGGGMYKNEANQNYSQLMITINFRNPIDIMPFEQGGMMYFDANRVPFSGVYTITQVSHSFKDGNFKQRLSVLRMPGQILDYSVKPTNVEDLMSSTPSPEDQQIPSTGREFAPSQRLDVATAFSQLGRGLPSPGLPGIASNFVSAPGGVGVSISSLLNQTPGVGNILSAGSSLIGKALPTDAMSNIRLSSSGLADLAQSKLGSAALLAVAANVVTGNVPAKRAIGVLAGAVAGSVLASAIKVPNQGSGIGAGSTVSIPSTVPTNLTANDIKFGAGINASSLSADSVSSTVKTIGQSAVTAVSSLGKDAASLVNNIGDKIKSLAGSPADPQAIGARLGINSSALSGLSSPLSSKVLDQVKGLVDNIPSDVNLKQSVDAGLVLDYVPSAKISNIPPSAPFSTAPTPEVDTAYLKQVVSTGGKTALENLYGVNDISKISTNIVPPDLINTALSSTPNAQLNILSKASSLLNSVDASAIKDKLLTAGSQLSKLTGQSSLLDSSISGSVLSKFGSGSAGSSPLDKLVNRMNDPSAPLYTGNDPIVRARLGLPPTTNG